MSAAIQIRSYHPGDLAQAKALDARVKPYRPEDQPEVEAMFERARQAKASGDRWLPPSPPYPALEQIEEVYLAFWVAVLLPDTGASQVVGTVGVYRAGTDPEMWPDMPQAGEWRRRTNVAELRRLRVAPELRRQGIATRLNQAAIAWCREHDFRTLIVNTTAAQIPALNLYRKLGFQEIYRSFIDQYELVWFELAL
jgi:GNAT superfamily N-acetyltransferase